MLDPYDSIGAIDKYFPITYFFWDFERFERFLYKNKYNKVELTEGFENLQRISYKKILKNEGFDILETENSINNVCNLRKQRLFALKNDYHPLAKKFIDD